MEAYDAPESDEDLAFKVNSYGPYQVKGDSARKTYLERILKKYHNFYNRVSDFVLKEGTWRFWDEVRDDGKAKFKHTHDEAGNLKQNGMEVWQSVELIYGIPHLLKDYDQIPAYGSRDELKNRSLQYADYMKDEGNKLIGRTFLDPFHKKKYVVKNFDDVIATLESETDILQVGLYVYSEKEDPVLVSDARDPENLTWQEDFSLEDSDRQQILAAIFKENEVSALKTGSVNLTADTEDSHALGYGELNRGSLMKVFDAFEMDSTSRFLDVGSGLGKPVLTAATLGVPSTGIDVVPVYIEEANELLEKLRQKYPFFKTPVKFLQENAIDFDYTPYTHIYAFDYVFGTAGNVLEINFHKGVNKAMRENPDFKAFVSFKTKKRLQKEEFDFSLIDEKRTKIIKGLRSIGGRQSYTAHIYYLKKTDTDVLMESPILLDETSFPIESNESLGSPEAIRISRPANPLQKQFERIGREALEGTSEGVEPTQKTFMELMDIQKRFRSSKNKDLDESLDELYSKLFSEEGQSGVEKALSFIPDPRRSLVEKDLEEYRYMMKAGGYSRKTTDDLRKDLLHYLATILFGQARPEDLQFQYLPVHLRLQMYGVQTPRKLDSKLDSEDFDEFVDYNQTVRLDDMKWRVVIPTFRILEKIYQSGFVMKKTPVFKDGVDIETTRYFLEGEMRSFMRRENDVPYTLYPNLKIDDLALLVIKEGNLDETAIPETTEQRLKFATSVLLLNSFPKTQIYWGLRPKESAWGPRPKELPWEYPWPTKSWESATKKPWGQRVYEEVNEEPSPEQMEWFEKFAPEILEIFAAMKPQAKEEEYHQNVTKGKWSPATALWWFFGYDIYEEDVNIAIAIALRDYKEDIFETDYRNLMGEARKISSRIPDPDNSDSPNALSSSEPSPRTPDPQIPDEYQFQYPDDELE